MPKPFPPRIVLIVVSLIACGASIISSSTGKDTGGFASITCDGLRGCAIEGRISEGTRVTAIDLGTNHLCSGKTGRSYSVPPSVMDNADDPPRFFTPVKLDPACREPGLARADEKAFEAISRGVETSDALDKAVQADPTVFGFQEKDGSIRPKPLARDSSAPLVSYSLPGLRLTVGQYSWGGFCPRSAVLFNGSPLSLESGADDDNVAISAEFLGLIKWKGDVVLGMKYGTCESDDPGVVVLYRVDPSGASRIGKY